MNATRHAATTRATRRPLSLAILLALAAFASAPAGAQDAADAAAAPEAIAQDAADATADADAATDAAAAPAAQDAADPAAELEAVIVTANKREEDVRSVATSITVVDAEKLEHLQARQLTDFAAYIPSLQVTSLGAPGRTTITMRGVAVLSSGSTIGTYIDEVPVGSSGIYQAATVFALDLLPYDIERIEVLRGPQGTLYGAGSMGGLLKYVTRDPDLEQTELRFGAGVSDVESGGALGANIRFGANMPLVEDKVGVRVSYMYNKIPGYIDNEVDGEQNINDGSQESGRAELLWQGDNASLSLTAMSQEIDSDNNALVALDPTDLEPLYGDLVNSVFVDEPFSKDLDFYSATFNWDLGWGEFVSATGYTETRTRQRQDGTLIYGEFANLALGLPEPGSSAFDVGLDLDKFTQEFRLVSGSEGPFEWMVGGFYSDEDGVQTQSLYLNQLDGSPLPPPFDAIAGTLAVIKLPSNYKEIAGFANGSYRFNDWFKLEAGVRYASNEQEFVQSVTEGIILPIEDSPGESDEDVFTWSLSPVFQLSEDVMLYGRAASGYQPGGPNVAVAGLPSAVDSSTLDSYELGLKAGFMDQRLQFDVTGFYIDWTDIQIATSVNGVSGLVNGGEATTKGFELSSMFQATENFSLGINATYTDASIDDDFATTTIVTPDVIVEITNGLGGDALPYVPEWAWSALADYYFPVAGLDGHVGAGLRWVDDQVNDTTGRQVVSLPTDPPTVVADELTPPLELDIYFALDLYADLSGANWTVRAYARNLTDERGYQRYTAVNSAVTGATANIAAAPIQPRTIGLEFDFRF